VNQITPVTSKQLLGFKIKRAASEVQKDYANGFIKACQDKQVEPEKLIAAVEALDIHL